MAVKKAVTPKAGSTSKSTPQPQAAAKTAAPAESTKSAGARARPTPIPKGAANKAPAVKLSDAQGRVLSAVHQAMEAGYLGNKPQAKTLDVLLQKKLIKRGKKEGGFFRYMVTKAGAKHLATPSAPAPSAPAPSTPPAGPEAVAAPAPVPPA